MDSNEHMSLPTRMRTATLAERIDAGRSARRSHPRRAIGAWEPMSDRPDPVGMLEAQESTRVSELLPIRHARMSESPFAFYRGTAALMAYDLGTTQSSGIVTQLCGDAHLSNLGLFAGPDRSLVFDLNDFDETHPGPFEWDLVRLTTSFLIAARDNGFTAAEQREMVTAAAETYRISMAKYAGMTDLDVWYDRLDAQQLLTFAKAEGGKAGAKGMNRTFAKARKRDRWSAVEKLTTTIDGRPVFIENPPLIARIKPDGEAWKDLERLFDEYRETLVDDRRELLRRYRPIDWAHKVVGVGSVGLLAFVLLMQGRDESDLLVVQVKEAVRSVLEPYAGTSRFSEQGHRVVSGQRMMQASSDVFLGWLTGTQQHEYYVRQLRDMKWSPEISTLGPVLMRGYAVLCGQALARAHARAGDAVTISAYLGTGPSMDRSLVEFAERYATQVEGDFHAFTSAIESGRLTTTHDEAESVAESLRNRFVHATD